VKKILGIDLGGVVFDFKPVFKPEGLTREEVLATPEVRDSIESLAYLNQTIFKDSIYLVSKYGKNSGPDSTKDWLEQHNFHERTGIPIDHLYQCSEKEGKAPIVKKLGITHFVDDRAEVMSFFADFVPNLYHFQSLCEDRTVWASKIPHLIFVHDWKELTQILLEKNA
jgi:hypothetical protein